jgi:hypothetical protein
LFRPSLSCRGKLENGRENVQVYLIFRTAQPIFQTGIPSPMTNSIFEIGINLDAFWPN